MDEKLIGIITTSLSITGILIGYVYKLHKHTINAYMEFQRLQIEQSGKILEVISGNRESSVKVSESLNKLNGSVKQNTKTTKDLSDLIVNNLLKSTRIK